MRLFLHFSSLNPDPVYSVPFSISTPLTEFCLSSLAYARALRFPLFRLSHGDFSFCLRWTCPRIQPCRDALTRKCSRILSRGITASCVSFPAYRPERERAFRVVSRRLKGGKGEKDGAEWGCFAPESRSLTTIHLNRASNIARARACDVLSTDFSATAK